MTEKRDQGSSIVNVTIGGQTFPVKHYESCNVCTSPYRLDLERALVGGQSYKNIVKGLVEGRDHDGDPPTTQDLSYHVRQQHLPLQDTQKRALVERRAKEIGQSIEDGQELLLDYVGVNEAIIQRGFERISNKEIDPNMTDLLNALRLQHSIEKTQDGTVSDDVWMEAMITYMEIAREVMPAEIFAQFGEKLEQSPVLQALADKIRKNNAQREIEG